MNVFLNNLLKANSIPFIYVDCGARGESRNSMVEALSPAQYYGFEPDDKECKRLNSNRGKSYSFLPYAVSDKVGKQELYLLNNPACSSLLPPNTTFWGKFHACSKQIEIQKTVMVETITLDQACSQELLPPPDFLELDTQGNEFQILNGSRNILKQNVLGMKIECEFSQMYKEQFLFSDIDELMRSMGFMLFDLRGHRYRRECFPAGLPTRGQLLYGNAFYLKDFKEIGPEGRFERSLKLAFIADHLGFKDYGFEILESVIQETSALSGETRKEIRLAMDSMKSLPSLKKRLVFFLAKCSLCLPQQIASRIFPFFEELGRIRKQLNKTSWED